MELNNGESDDSMDDDFEPDSHSLEDEEEEVDDGELDEDPLGSLEDNSLSSFLNHSDSVYCITTHPKDPLLVATGGGDDRGFIWSIEGSQVIAQLDSHTDSITSIGFNKDGNLLATAGLDGVVNLWASSPDFRSWTKIHTLSGPGGGIEWIDWHPAGNVLLAGSDDSTMWMWSLSSNLQTANCLNVFAGHSASVSCGRFTPSGKQILSGSADGSLRIWNPKTANCDLLYQGADYHQGQIVSMSCHSNNQLVVTGSIDHTAAISNLQSRRIFGFLRGHTDSVESVVISENFGVIATGSLDMTVKIWDLNTLQMRTSMAHEDGIVKVMWDREEGSSLVYACGLDHTIKVWDARTGQPIHSFSGHLQPVLDFDFTCDRRHLVSCSDDNRSLVFRIEEDYQHLQADSSSDQLESQDE